MRTVKVPVNAASEADALSALTRELRKSGRTILGVPTIEVEPLRPFERVAIECTGAAACYVVTVQCERSDAR